MGKKVSVITVNLNNRAGLESTFESVISQDYPSLEYLIIDGESKDGSKEFIQANSEKINFWLSERDSGVYEAMNKGIRNATGDYLIFLNSGDTFTGPDSISKLIFGSQGEELVFGNILVEETEKSWIKKYPDTLTFKYFYFESIPHPACLISRKLFDQIGLYDTSLKIASDWKFFLLAVVKNNCSYRYVDQLISTFRLGGMSSTKENEGALEYERRSTLRKYFFLDYMAYSLLLKFQKNSIYKKL